MFKNNRILKISILCLVILTLFVSILSGCGKKEETSPITEVVQSNPVVEEPKVEEPKVEEPKIEEPEVVEPEVVKYSYEDDLVGIKFNHNQEFYSKKDVVEVVNTIKEVIPEGETAFNIYEHKLPGLLRLITLANSENIVITASIMPFEIDKETTTIKLNGAKEVTNEFISSIDLTDEELIAQMDKEIKASIADMGCEIVSFDGSKIVNIGKDAEENPLRAIITNRVYSGPKENTTEKGVVEVHQCTIPIGKNAVVFTLMSDGEPTTLDRVVVFEEIINSFVVVTPAPVPVETTEGTETTPAE